MGRLTGPQTCMELVRAKIHNPFEIKAEYRLMTMETVFTLKRLTDGKTAEIAIGDEEFVRIDYPDLLAEAITDELLKAILDDDKTSTVAHIEVTENA